MVNAGRNGTVTRRRERDDVKQHGIIETMIDIRQNMRKNVSGQFDSYFKKIERPRR